MSMNTMKENKPVNEKISAAIQSVLAAVGLTVFKLIVGLMTNSLGILAEAAHSGLDMIAAAVTTIAVHISDQPPDKEHQFGHGKVENISALIETLLLLATAAWIIYEAVHRLFYKSETVQVSIWAFVVMGVSIIVDINRSRMLYRVAEKYNSQALEADALHFRTDIWSSAVVLVGLFGIQLAEKYDGLQLMIHADAVAALAVALIVLFVSGEMGWRAVQALLDKAPEGIKEQIIELVEQLDDINRCQFVRVRSSGASWFVDLHIEMNGNVDLEESHAKTTIVEELVQQLLTDADVTVHVEPEISIV